MRRVLELLRAARFAAPLALADAARAVHKRTTLDFSKARARCGFSRGHLLDVVVYVPGGIGDQRETQAAESFVKLLVGEELFERWVGTVSATPAPRGGPLTVLNSDPELEAAFAIAALPEALHAAITALKAGFATPALSAHAERDDWVLFELDPGAAVDYAAQDDLLLSSTCVPELKKSFLRREPFFSGRFSNSGELFAYLKYEPREGALQGRLAERAVFEELLTRSLRPEQGALVGLGLGVRYAYLDLALNDPDYAREQLLPALRSAGIAKRAWLLFCDSELEREWLGVYPDSPEPFWG